MIYPQIKMLHAIWIENETHQWSKSNGLSLIKVVFFIKFIYNFLEYLVEEDSQLTNKKKIKFVDLQAVIQLKNFTLLSTTGVLS